MPLILAEKTEVLRRCFFDVQNEVGLGRNEEAYHKACKHWFIENGIPVLSKAPHNLGLNGDVAHTLYPDFVAWNSITVELKSIPRHTRTAEYVQLFDYLKCRKDKLGLLVNMGLDRVHVERFVYDASTTELVEDWSYWANAIDGNDRLVGAGIRDALQGIYQEHGTGYGEEVTERLIRFQLQAKGLKVTYAPVAKAYYRGDEVDESSLSCYLVGDRIVLNWTALFDDNRFSVNRGRSYMRALGVRWGIAVNFGKTTLEMTGLRNRSGPRMAGRTHG